VTDKLRDPTSLNGGIISEESKMQTLTSQQKTFFLGQKGRLRAFLDAGDI
jgi:hypothetical protein